MATAAGRCCLATEEARIDAVRRALRGVDKGRRRARGEEENAEEDGEGEGGEDGGDGEYVGAVEGGVEPGRRRKPGLDADMEAVVEPGELLACEEGRWLFSRCWDSCFVQ